MLDTNDHRVLVISGTGTIADTLGRFGSGPGELQLPAALSIDTAGNVVVYDRAKAGLVRWSPEGVPLGEIRIAAQSLGPAIAATAAGVLFTGFEPERPGPDHQRLVVWSDSSERGLARIARLPYRRADFPACGLRGITISPLSSPELVWHAERLSA